MKHLLLAGSVYESIFEKIDRIIEPGISVMNLSSIIRKTLYGAGCRLIDGTRAISININNVVYHNDIFLGILEVGDLVTVDICCCIDGFIIDGAKTYEVKIQKYRDLMEVSKRAIKAGLVEVSKGSSIAGVIEAIDSYVGLRGFYLYPDGMGHGIGNKLHERPYISMGFYDDFNYHFKAGDMFTLEPIILLKKEAVILGDDGVGRISEDNVSSQFEVTVILDSDLSPIVINKALIK